MLTNIITGLSGSFEPYNFMMLLCGVFVGVVFGALPGLTGVMAIALFIPFTYSLDLIPAILFLVGIYNGSVFGGSITAILVKVPGDTGNAATVFDGYAMAQKGEAGKALGIAAVTSSIGGIFASLILLFLAPLLADVAVTFGPAEYFAMAFMGLSAITSLGVNNQLKSITSCIIGLVLACIGMDAITGADRLTFGSPFLQDGIPLVPALIGLFAFSELFKQINDGIQDGEALVKNVSTKLPSLNELWQLRKTIFKSSIIGTWIGILPGAGATLASFLGYTEAVRSSKKPEEFGTGIAEGVAAAETANNAAVGGSFIPTLALGIPGSGSTALLLSALTLHGIRTGPMIFVQQPKMVYTIIIGVLLTNFIFLFMGVWGTRYFGKLLEIPYNILFPTIVTFTIVGSYAVRNNIGDLWLMFGMGVIGYLLLIKGGFPVAPIILGLVLGPLTEMNFRRAYLLNGDLMGIITRPIAGTLILFSIIFLLSPLSKKIISGIKTEKLKEASSVD